jgi:hypothetical protein
MALFNTAHNVYASGSAVYVATFGGLSFTTPTAPVNAPIDLKMNKPVETYSTDIELK